MGKTECACVSRQNLHVHAYKLGQSYHPPGKSTTLEDRAMKLALKLPPVLDVPSVVGLFFGLEIRVLRQDPRHHCGI